MVVNWSLITMMSGVASFAIVYALAGQPDIDKDEAVGFGEFGGKATCVVTDYRSSDAGYELLVDGRWILLGGETAMDRIPHAGGHAILCTRLHRRSVSL